MKILIFSHSGSLGGAERALVNLIKILLIQNHELMVALPTAGDELASKLKTLGVAFDRFPFTPSLPNPSNALLKLFNEDTRNFIRRLKNCSYELVISNTLTSLQGALIAKELEIPCITYAHEYLIPKEDLSPHGCNVAYYLQLINSYSNHILCASSYIKNSLPQTNKCSVLYPFENDVSDKSSEKYHQYNEKFSLLVIGTKSRRKNIHFSLTVLKALRLRGVDIDLFIIGTENSGSYKLNQQILLKGDENISVSSYKENPYEIPGRKINLICAYSEPFGLTITESLQRGIPVAASKSGGPNEILTEEFLYEINNIDGCVRLIEKIISNYESYSEKSTELYSIIAEKNREELRSSIITNSIESSLLDHKNSGGNKALLNLEAFQEISSPLISIDQIIENISSASTHSSQPLSTSEIYDLVNEEIDTPGSSVLRDIHAFDVVPFGHSSKMNQLYKSGLGLSIELLANIGDEAKRQMIAFIVLRLQELKLQHNKMVRVLCLGDGLGVDSLVLANCGLDVDYLDFDESLMSKCAELNFKTAISNSKSTLNLSVRNKPCPPYDAVVSLEVIEHVPNPQEFLKFIHENMVENGLLFISECFDGIYDRWPTHLYSNEHLAATLPIIAAPFFKLEDINTSPLGKPYVFSKTSDHKIDDIPLRFFYDPTFLYSLHGAITRIGY